MRRVAQFLPLAVAVCFCASLPAQTPPSILPGAGILQGYVGEAFSQQFTVQNASQSWTFQGWSIASGSLPAGLSLNSATGVISGVPTSVGSAFFQLQANYLIQTSPYAVSSFYTIQTDVRARWLTTSPLPPATAGVNTVRSVAVTMISSWDVGRGTLPASISIQFPGEGGGTSITLSGVFPAVASPTTYSFTAYANAIYSSQTLSQTFSITVNPAPALSGGLPNGTVGTAYSAALAVSGGTPPLAFSLVSGSLPPGLSLSPGTGSISGTPSTAGSYSFMAAVTDANGASARSSYSISVQVPDLRITSPGPSAGVVGQPYSFQFTATGGIPPYSWSIPSGSLPPGLSLAAGSGLLTGTPTAAGQYAYSVMVQDSIGNTGTLSYRQTVSGPPLAISTSALPDGVLNTAYSARIDATGGTPPYRFSVVLGNLPPGISLAADGTLSGTPTAAGTFSFTAGVSDAAQQSATKGLSITISATPPTPSITTTSLPSGIKGVAYSAQIAASGGTPPLALTLSSGSLPQGLSLAASGLISGTPGVSGSFPFGVTVTDGAKRTATASFTLVVVDPLGFTTGSLPAGEVGVAYSARLAAAGGTPPYSFSFVSGNLPAGVRLGADGSLTGTPTADGTNEFVARVTDSGRQVSDGVFQILVQTRPAITTASLPDGTAGTAYATTLAGRGTSPLSWSVSSGSLPPGLSLASGTGAISGQPAAAGSATFTITLTDGRGLTATRDFTLQILLPTLGKLNASQLPASTPSASQPAFGLALAQASPIALSGTANLRFTPDAGLPDDPDVRFSNGTTTVNFTIPAGQAAAVPASGSAFAFQAGTTAGTITLTISLRSGSTVVTPDPALTQTIRVERAAPVITSVRVNRTSSGFDVVVTGYSNTREISGSSFAFTPAAGSTLANSTVTVAVQSVFQSWYADARSRSFGGQFLLTVSFNVQGGSSAITGVQVTLTNSVGSGSGSANF